MTELKEEWKDIKGYEGLYKISNFGKVWSYHYNKNLKVLVSISRKKYKTCMFILCNNKKRKHYKTHHLVWDHFGDKKRDGHKLQVDHIDNNQLNNRIDNLQLLNNRDNISKDIDKTKTLSKYIGVETKDNTYYSSRIVIDGKRLYLGSFNNEYDAHLAYQKKLNELKTSS